MNKFNTILGLGILALIIFGFLLFKFWFIALNIVGGFLLYFLLDAILDFFERRGIHGVAAYLMLFIISTAALIAFVLFVSIPLVEQTQSLVSQLPQLSEDFKGKIAELTAGFPALESLQLTVKEKALELAQNALSISGNIVASVLTIILIALILLTSRSTLHQQFTEQIPNDYFEITVGMTHRIMEHIQNYTVAKAVETAIVIFLHVIGFWLTGLPHALLFGVVAGVFNIIPYIGPLISAVPICIGAYLYGGYPLVGLSILIILVAQLIDNTILQTWLISKFVDVHPVIVVIITLIAAEVGGIVGMVIAIPAYVVAKIIIQGLYTYVRSVQRHELILRKEESYN